jgi:transcriptional regulator with XRE-family HTH domain/predicted transcriptional regulator
VSTFDTATLGQRIRHFRRRVGLTLSQLGDQVGKPAPYLSLVENGKREPKLSFVSDVARALGVGVEDLIDPQPPSRRAQLELEFERLQQAHSGLGLPQLRTSPRLSDEVLAHLIGLYENLDRTRPIPVTASEVRRANGILTRELEAANGYFPHIEAAAAEAVAKSGYTGSGPLSSRHLLDLAFAYGFEVRAIDEMPTAVRSLVDLGNRVIYIPQRNELRTRQARKAILQTLAGFVLGHKTASDYESLLRNRRESAYFASAVLIPQSAAVPFLKAAVKSHDLSVEDLREVFYSSYDMAAHRLANLATAALDLQSHLVVSDREGIALKAYSNDGVPFPRDEEGGVEAQRLCREWSARSAADSADRFSLHYQYTDTPAGTYFCFTYLEPEGNGNAVTFGVNFKSSQVMRGRETDNRRISACPSGPCCRVPDPDLARRWEGKVVASPRSQSAIVGLLAPDIYPSLDFTEIYELLDRQ